MGYRNIARVSCLAALIMASACGSTNTDSNTTPSGGSSAGGGAAKGGTAGLAGSTSNFSGSGGLGTTAGAGGSAGFVQVGGGGAGGGGGIGGSGGQGQAGQGGATSSCTEASKSIYLIAMPQAANPSAPGDITLWKYAPDNTDIAKSTLTSVGKLDCPDTMPFFDIPFAMAIDQSGVGWVAYGNFTDSPPWSEKLYNVDITSAKCTKTSYVSKSGVAAPYSMAFVKDTPASTTETLYVAALVTPALGTLDLAKLELSPSTAKVDQPGSIAGNAAGKLFEFRRTPAPYSAFIDPMTGAESQPHNLTDPMFEGFRGWPIIGFVSWGGDAWAFLAHAGSNSTAVHRISSTTGMDQTATISDRTFVVAGASTCAPSAP